MVIRRRQFWGAAADINGDKDLGGGIDKKSIPFSSILMYKYKAMEGTVLRTEFFDLLYLRIHSNRRDVLLDCSKSLQASQSITFCRRRSVIILRSQRVIGNSRVFFSNICRWWFKSHLMFLDSLAAINCASLFLLKTPIFIIYSHLYTIHYL